MSERESSPWNPNLPQALKPEEKIPIAQDLTKRLAHVLFQENPSTVLVGLPAHQLNRLAEFSKESPASLLEASGISKEFFLFLASRFENHFITTQLKDVDEQDDLTRQRMVDIVARSAFRGDVDISQHKGLSISSLRTEVELQIAQYKTGEKQFDGLKPQDLFAPKVQ